MRACIRLSAAGLTMSHKQTNPQALRSVMAAEIDKIRGRKPDKREPCVCKCCGFKHTRLKDAS